MIHRIAFLLVFVWSCLNAFTQITLPPYKQYTLRDGLSQMQVLCMLQDSRGYIWIGTKEGLNCFNGEKFQKYTKKDGLANDYIYELLEDKAGKIWMSTPKGLAYFDGEKIESISHDKLTIPNIALDGNGKVWYYGCDEKRNGYFGYIDNGKYVSKIDNFPSEGKMFTTGLLFSLAHENRFILCHYNKWYSYCNGKFELIIELADSSPFYSSSRKFYLAAENSSGWLVYEVVGGKPIQRAVVKNGKYIFNTLSEKVTILAFLKSTVYEFSPDTFRIHEKPDILPSKQIVDRDGNQWIGSEEGIFKMFGNGFTTYSRQFLPTVWGITEGLDGSIWFTSYNLGLKRLKNGILNHVKLPEPEMGWNLYFHPSVDKKGRLFFPSYNGTLVVDGESIYQEKSKPSISSFYDRDKDLLFLGDHDTLKVFTTGMKLIRMLSAKNGFQVGANVLATQKDRNGFYWFSGGKGIARYDWNSEKVFSYNEANGRFKGGGAWVIRNDYYKRTWFGTKQGLYWYDEKNDSLKKLDVEELSGSVNLVESVDSTWLISSQPYGIYLMDLQKYYKTGEPELYLYNEKNGFLGIEPGQDGAFTDSKGNVWMTTSTEVVKLNPKKLNPKKHFMNIRIEKLNGKSLPFNANKITLPQNQNSAVLTFDAICFNRPNHVQYSWKSENDTAWSAWQEENYAVISELSDGSNKIKVRAKIVGLPLSNLAQTDIDLHVQLAIYRQPWFFPTILALVSLLVLLTVLLLIQTRTKMLQVNKQAKTFQLQAILSQMNPHFIFNVLAALQSMILSANIEKANDYLVRMSSLVRGFLEASLSTSSSKSKEMQNGEITLKKELEMLQTFIEFQQLIYPDKFDYKLSIDPAISPDKITIPPMLIQPFVENAIRHGLLQKEEKGLLELTISIDTTRHLSVIISDNGIGIKRATEIIGKSHLLYKSRGRELTEKRIKLMNEMGYRILCLTESSDQGTIVTLNLDKHES